MFDNVDGRVVLKRFGFAGRHLRCKTRDKRAIAMRNGAALRFDGVDDCLLFDGGGRSLEHDYV